MEGATNGFSPPPIELEETPSQADDDLDLSADLHRFNSDSLLDEPESAPTTESLSEQSPSSRGEALVVEEDHVEEWEADLEECISAATEPRPWSELRKQIMTDLTKRKNTLTLAQTNQLLIIQNFANLRIKGQKRMEASMAIAQQWHESSNPVYFARKIRALARHYQLFEQLPDEGRGGSKNGRSLLDDPLLVTALRNWLTSQPVGSVTPRNFQHAVNTALLPSLGISLKSPICYRTAQRWLVKVGWRLTVLRKGVYMDGHERPDVVEYRNNVFLPKMAEYERRMVHFEGPDLTRVEPVLKEGETEIVVYFQDESCFHANEYKSRAWLGPGQTVLQKKSRGRLIHVSDFVTPLTGRAVIRDESGNIIQDARKIIFPGANGDPYWDHAQLQKQVEGLLSIHEKLHPGKTALVVFDCSSAHEALPPDALRAFEMNKSDGGKQRRQRDTVIPNSNPKVSLRGQVQKMTLPDGTPKGLQTVLEERGFNVKGMRAKCAPVCPWENTNCCMARLMSKQEDFTDQVSMLETLITGAGHLCIFLPKFHCELNPIEMYWGWAKYRYREIRKTTFQHAKDVAIEKLNACPLEAIRRFINRSWRFMSAYRLGLTGDAAAWAVRKQRQHRQVSQRAMMSIEAVLNK